MPSTTWQKGRENTMTTNSTHWNWKSWREFQSWRDFIDDDVLSPRLSQKPIVKYNSISRWKGIRIPWEFSERVKQWISMCSEIYLNFTNGSELFSPLFSISVTLNKEGSFHLGASGSTCIRWEKKFRVGLREKGRQWGSFSVMVAHHEHSRGGSSCSLSGWPWWGPHLHS